VGRKRASHLDLTSMSGLHHGTVVDTAASPVKAHLDPRPHELRVSSEVAGANEPSPAEDGAVEIATIQLPIALLCPTLEPDMLRRHELLQCRQLNTPAPMTVAGPNSDTHRDICSYDVELSSDWRCKRAVPARWMVRTMLILEHGRLAAPNDPVFVIHPEVAKAKPTTPICPECRHHVDLHVGPSARDSVCGSTGCGCTWSADSGEAD
jgi:hypothetical protein